MSAIVGVTLATLLRVSPGPAVVLASLFIFLTTYAISQVLQTIATP